jgi:hypothetical protein
VALGASFLGSRACLEALVWYASARGRNTPVPALQWRLGGNGWCMARALGAAGTNLCARCMASKPKGTPFFPNAGA